MTILETGLQQRKKSVINIIRAWDEKIFPDSESSIVNGKKNDDRGGSDLKKAMDLLEADEEEEEEEDM